MISVLIRMVCHFPEQTLLLISCHALKMFVVPGADPGGGGGGGALGAETPLHI